MEESANKELTRRDLLKIGGLGVASAAILEFTAGLTTLPIV